jgi:hypothetical protein
MIHNRCFPLQCTPEWLNSGQGLGFMVLNKVVDKKTLTMIVVGLVSFLGSAIPILIAVSDPVVDEDWHPDITDVYIYTNEGAALCRAVLAVAEGTGVCVRRNTTLQELLDVSYTRTQHFDKQINTGRRVPIIECAGNNGWIKFSTRWLAGVKMRGPPMANLIPCRTLQIARLYSRFQARRTHCRR